MSYNWMCDVKRLGMGRGCHMAERHTAGHVMLYSMVCDVIRLGFLCNMAGHAMSCDWACDVIQLGL